MSITWRFGLSLSVHVCVEIDTIISHSLVSSTAFSLINKNPTESCSQYSNKQGLCLMAY